MYLRFNGPGTKNFDAILYVELLVYQFGVKLANLKKTIHKKWILKGWQPQPWFTACGTYYFFFINAFINFLNHF